MLPIKQLVSVVYFLYALWLPEYVQMSSFTSHVVNVAIAMQSLWRSAHQRRACHRLRQHTWIAAV
jgi:hypothetical protein